MMVCGVLGPKSNAHGPNEFLHVPYAKKLTAAVAQVIAAMPVTHPAHATSEAGTDSTSA
jgi:acetylornithine deacetylase/succinyl-diaminopimelate desuccinylase-like protein